MKPAARPEIAPSPVPLTAEQRLVLAALDKLWASGARPTARLIADESGLDVTRVGAVVAALARLGEVPRPQH